ncbi:MAG: PAS domain S-box protein [Kiloniellales bacterium]
MVKGLDLALTLRLHLREPVGPGSQGQQTRQPQAPPHEMPRICAAAWGREGTARMSMIHRVALVFLPLALVAGGVMYLLYRVQVSATTGSLQATERNIVELGRQYAATELGSAISDILYLSEQETLRRWLASDEPATRRDLASDFEAFAKHKTVYNQVRLLDVTGRELVRVDWRDDAAFVVPDEQLQNKSDRYYVTETRKLGRGQVYVSPFDLNIEHGQVEQPIKPTIRIETPIVDAAGRKRGLVVLNYNGSLLLERIKALARPASGNIWLLNAAGYWLLGPSPEDEWGFMFPERGDRTFGQAYPEAWAMIQNGAISGQLLADGDLFTYTTVRQVTPHTARLRGAGEAPAVVSPEPWVLLARIPAERLAAQRAELAGSIVIASVGLAFLLAAVAFGIAYYWTRHREAEQRTRASEAHFRAVTQSAGEAIISADSDGRIINFNAAAERIFGYAADEALGRPLTILMPERLHEAHREGFERFLAIREPRVIGQPVELTGRRKSGEEFPVELSLASWEGSQDLFFTGILRDVTLRKQAEQELRRREVRFRGLLESAPDGIVITDKDGRIVLTNMQTERLFGYDRKELLGRHVEMLMPERYRGQHVGHRTEYVTLPQPRPMGLGLELRGLRRDGTEFPIAISLSPFETEEGLLVFADVRDVTEQRRSESKIRDLNLRLARRNAELTALNNELDAFSYSVSHDLRAPLRAIDGFSQAILEDCAEQLDEVGQSHLTRIRRAAQRMGLLIDDLLNLSRVSRRELSIEDIDLSATAEEVASELRDSAPDRPVTLSVAPRLHARGDQRLLRIVLDNLIGNAWKFTLDRSPALIEFGRTDVNGSPAYFVRDNGVGFDMAYADKLFGAFQRLHNAADYPGTGIGLATVQRIISKHGGRIWAESERDRGATFYFTL